MSLPTLETRAPSSRRLRRAATVRFRARLGRLLPVLWAGMAAACGDPAGPTISQVFLVPPSVTLVSPGTEAAFEVGAVDGDLAPVTPTGVRWTSSDPNIATVDPDGRVVAVSNGVVFIEAESEGVVGRAEVRVLVFEALAAGSNHTCGLTIAGRAYCWGWNARGALGDGDRMDRAFPGPIELDVPFLALAADGHTCGIQSGGLAYCWGGNDTGQLGDASNVLRRSPTPVLGGHRYQAIAAGVATCGLTVAGAGYCWGQNSSGELGDGTTTERWTPSPVVGGHTFTEITVGGGQSCGLDADGIGYCWGFNGVGQIGNGARTVEPTPEPQRVESGPVRFGTISAGASHTCAVGLDERAYCWGSNASGKLGDPSIVHSTDVPAPITGSEFASVYAKGEYTCGLTPDGRAFCWGANAYGQLGDGTTTDRPVPVAVAGSHRFSMLTLGSAHACGVTLDAVAYCWGANLTGQLGDGTTGNRSTPIRIRGGPES